MDLHIPLRLILLEDLSLRVVSNDLDVDETAQIELLRPEHRHVGNETARCRDILHSDGLSLAWCEAFEDQA